MKRSRRILRGLTGPLFVLAVSAGMGLSIAVALTAR